MSIRKLRAAPGAWLCCVALLAGCQPGRPQASTEAKRTPEAADLADEARGAADASLGKQSEILLRGDLAQNGREQILVVNRYSPGAEAGAGSADSSAIFVTRAAILETDSGKWSEVLLCDEHLKNPNGYLGGSSAARVTGWRLEYNQGAGQGLEMKFTPADSLKAGNGSADQGSRPAAPAFDVRWNKKAKRYESYDQSHERYLNEVPSLETPQSILK
jgi:hypothetical protein